MVYRFPRCVKISNTVLYIWITRYIYIHSTCLRIFRITSSGIELLLTGVFYPTGKVPVKFIHLPYTVMVHVPTRRIHALLHKYYVESFYVDLYTFMLYTPGKVQCIILCGRSGLFPPVSTYQYDKDHLQNKTYYVGYWAHTMWYLLTSFLCVCISLTQVSLFLKATKLKYVVNAGFVL